jgi:predicted nuclease of predicted toxin-antitoxin system
MTEQDNTETPSLYVHLYFDEDVSLRIADNLRTRGFDVLSFRDADMAGKSDDEQMLYAVSQRRAIVTHNRVDFETQHSIFLKNGLKHYGVIVAKRHHKDAEVVAKLLNLLDSVTADEMENQLRYV